MNSLIRMTRQAFSDKRLTASALFFTVISCVCSLALPRIMADIVNQGIYQSDLPYVGKMSIVALITCAAMAVLDYFSNWVCTLMGERFGMSLRSEVYEHIQCFSLEQSERFGSGSLITRLTTDINSCSQLNRAVVVLLVKPIVQMIGGIVMMASIETSLGIVFLVFVLLQLILMFLFIRSTAPLFLKVRGAIDRMNAHVQDLLLNFRLIKAFDTRADSARNYDAVNRSLFDITYAAKKKTVLFDPLIMLLMNLALAAILYLSGVQTEQGAMSIGLILAAISYSEQILVSIVSGGRIFQVIAETKPSTDRLCELMAEPVKGEAEGDPFSETFRELTFDRVGFSYPGGGEVLRDVSFKISAGETVSLTGPTGSGKSTIAALCAALYENTSGDILLNGRNLSCLKADDVRRVVSLTEKHTDVPEGTLEESISFGREGVGMAEITQAIKAARLDDYVASSPEGLQTQVSSMGKNLSGGERQRLVIARALAGKPGLLILDDSTSAMDYQTEKELLEEVRQQYPSMAILVITHRLASTIHSDRTIVLDQGQIVADGIPSSLLRESPLYRQIWEAQSKKENCPWE